MNAEPLDPRAAGAKRLKDKVSIVTGAGQGIGAATARRLAEEGAIVVIADRVEAGVRRVEAELRGHGAESMVFLGDLSDWDACHRLMDETVARFGRIDVLVNNVGGAIRHKPYWEFTRDQIHEEMDRSLWPTMYCLRAVIPHMLRQGHGAVVNVGSSAVEGLFRTPYAAAKGAVHAITAVVGRELATKGIRVNCVAPHATEVPDRVTPRSTAALTPEEREARREAQRRFVGEGPFAGYDLIPMKRWGEPAEQAAAIAFLASDDASFMTGQVIWVGT